MKKVPATLIPTPDQQRNTFFNSRKTRFYITPAHVIAAKPCWNDTKVFEYFGSRKRLSLPNVLRDPDITWSHKWWLLTAFINTTDLLNILEPTLEKNWFNLDVWRGDPYNMHFGEYESQTRFVASYYGWNI